MRFAVETLEFQLDYTVDQIELYENLAAKCAKNLVWGVNIDHYGPLLQHRISYIQYLKDRRERLRNEIKSLVDGHTTYRISNQPR
ncbi:hypothetical protein [Paenibacillus sinopodophylli]|uniref:hypothetical protein n=1 Tax=Paenibacillus sinopodophylli TaxID=1837342 RepID=UPI00110CCBB3|nr:hypothetical protein [Paenibacillus sinopodophylli]